MPETNIESQTWTEHFGISEQLHQQWRVVGGTTPFLSWCLQTGAINEAQYMQWAAGRYQLPLVKESFFDLATVDQNWETGKFLYRWTAEILPLEEWDGVVRIACSEPPTKFNFERPHVFVLASPRQLQNLWLRFFPQSGVVPMPAPVAAATEAVSAPASKTEPETAAAPTPAPVVAAEYDSEKMLADFNAQADAQETVQLSDEHSEVGAVDLGSPDTQPYIVPEGFITDYANIDIPMPTFGVKTAAPAQEAVAAAVPAAIAAPETAPAPAVATLDDVKTTVGQTPLADIVIPAAPAAAPTPVPVATATHETAATTTPPATGFAQPTLPTAPESFDACETIEDVVACAFNKMTAHFQYKMALLPAGDQLTPWLWDGKWSRETPEERPHGIDILTPSFFRIVTRTSMPYHGHTRPAEVNDRFFKEWTAGAALPHVTLVPIVIADHIAVILMGGMDNVIEARAALSDMEQLARTAALACRRISDKTSAAAA